MANKIQIKRSTTNAAPTGLANGELAYTANGEILFLGHPDGSTGSIAIGGKRAPGTLTANQALVANSTSAIDKVIVANLVPTQIYANGTVGTAGHVLTSGAAGNVYWVAPTAGVAGSNSQVQFNANGVLSGDAGFTFDGVTDALILGGDAATTSPLYRVANSTTSANLSSATLTIGTTVVNASAVAAGSNAYMNTTAVFISTNATINSTYTASLVQVSNSTATANLTATSLTIGTSVVNSSAFAAGANLIANTSALLVGNSTVNAVLTQSSFDIDGTIAAGNTTLVGFINVSSTANVGGATTLRGTATVNGALTVANTAALGNTTVTGFINVSSTANVGGATNLRGDATVNGALTVANTAALGNTTVTGFINVSSTANVGGAVNLRSTLTVNGAITVPNTAALGNTTITGFANVTSTLQVGANVVLGTTTITANASVGTAGQVLTSGATGNVYWTTPTTGTVTSVTGGNGLTGSVSTTGALDVGAGNGITVAADSVAVNANSGLVANSTGVFVNANSGIVANSTGVFVLANTGIIANSTGVFVNPVLSLTDLTLSGNLDINGTLTTVDTTNLSVTDSLISLARGQTTANTLDIGFYGTYGNATVISYSGLFRDATDGVYKLFAGATPEPTTTVDTANVNFAFATLQSYLTTGALVANSTVVNITANSTVSVALTANTLSLTTALPGTSGGTGLSTYTSGDLLVANTGNTLSKLSLGTDGKVLQSNGTAVIYADLDGGTF